MQTTPFFKTVFLACVMLWGVTACTGDDAPSESSAEKSSEQTQVKTLPTPSPIQSQKTVNGTHEYRLANGMKLIVKPDTRAPVAVLQLWYRAGSAQELVYGHKSGIAHMTEHLMFKATKNMQSGEFSQTVADLGGSDNAFTSRDYTVYHQTIASEHIDTLLKMEADRMTGLAFDDDAFAREFLKERDVVAEERRLRVDDNPYATFTEALDAQIFAGTPYAHPVVGWADDIASYRVEDAKKWYKQWYAPNNATLVIVGDVDPKRVAQKVNAYFGSIPKNTHHYTKTPPTTNHSPIRLEQTGRVDIPLLSMKWPVPSLVTVKDKKEAYALSMLSAVLDGSHTAILPKQLVREKRIAHSASAGYGLFNQYGSTLTLSASPARGVSVKDLEQALLNVLEQVKTTPVSDEVLARIRTQVMASEVYGKDSMYNQATQLGMLDSLGLGWEHVDDFVNHIADITPADIQAVARKYLVANQATVAVLMPQAKDQAKKQTKEQTQKQAGE